MHNRYKPTYHNRRNTSTYTITPVSHLKFQRLLLFSVADISLQILPFKSSGILQVTVQTKHWENKVIQKAKDHCLISCFQVALWRHELLCLILNCLMGELPNQTSFLLIYCLASVIVLITTIMQSPHTFNFCLSKR